MNTIRVISSISWNTPSFFEAKIQELSSGKGQLIDWCHWIYHKADSDQNKNHIHFVLKPSRRIDTNWLRQQFVEPSDAIVKAKFERGETVTQDDLKPLGVMPFRQTTQMGDWLLYAVHDVGYLFKKGQSRNVRYSRSDLRSTSEELLEEQWLEAQDPIVSMTQRVVELYTVESMTFSEILQTGMVPPNLVYYFKQVLEGLDNTTVKRKGKWLEGVTL